MLRISRLNFNNRQSVPGRQPGNTMISEDSLPTKSRSLRAKSIAKRLATEKNQNETGSSSASGSHLKKTSKRSSSSSSKHHPMSKYRRKVANAKERERMKLVSEAFDKLSSVVPVYKMMTVQNQIQPAPPAPAATSTDLENKNPVTKVSTLRCAIAYINSLQRLIEDAERGVLDPSLYSLSEDDEIELDQPKKKVNQGQSKKVKKERKKKRNDHGKSSKNHKKSQQDNPLKRTKKTSGKSFKVRQYHASDFSTRIKHSHAKNQPQTTFKPMSKAQLNLAIAKGLQNCKPIYTPPPPMTKKNPVQTLTSTPVLIPQHFQQSASSTPLQLIQLRPLNLETLHPVAAMENDSNSEDYSNLESVFLTSSPCTSSTSSMMASSPTSSTSGSSSDSCFNAILEEPHILDDIQAVLMDADHFDLLV